MDAERRRRARRACDVERAKGPTGAIRESEMPALRFRGLVAAQAVAFTGSGP